MNKECRYYLTIKGYGPLNVQAYLSLMGSGGYHNCYNDGYGTWIRFNLVLLPGPVRSTGKLDRGTKIYKLFNKES